MTIIEPFMLGGVASYILLPLSTYALGFDPSLSWQYVVLFGLAPILFAAPAILPVAVITTAVSGAADRLEQLGLALVSVVVSVVTFLIASQWVHAPKTGFQTFALAVSSPFIGGVGIALFGATVIALARVGLILFSRIFGNKPSNV